MVDKEREVLVWLVEEGTPAWSARPPDLQEEAMGQATSQRTFGEVHVAVLLMLIGLCLTGSWMWYRGLAEPQPSAGAVTILAQQEVKAVGPEGIRQLAPHVQEAANRVRRVQLASEFTDLHAVVRTEVKDGYTNVRTHVIEYRNQVALVELFVRDERTGKIFRQTRAFRHTEQGWQSTASAGRATAGTASEDEVWGARQTWETAYLSIRYQPIDAATVAEVAPKLDQLYGKLRHDFGLPVTATAEIITIEVVTDRIVERDVYISGGYTIRLPSPALRMLPVETTAADLFYQSVVFPLAGMVLAQIEDHAPDTWTPSIARWTDLSNALRFWALWGESSALVAEHEETLRWLYQNAQGNPSQARQVLPPGYDRLCRTYRNWEVSPAALQVLIDCKARLPTWRDPSLPMHLAEQVNGVFRGEAAEAGALLTTVALETVIEYVVATYGRDELPRLIAGRGVHDSWQTLIPALFHISAEEFEADWQAYLAQGYE